MQTVTDAELLVSKPGSSTTDFVVPNDDILRLNVDERAGREVAKGEITLDAANGQYVNADAATETLSGWGDAWGTMPWGGSTRAVPEFGIDDKIVIKVTETASGGSAAFGDGPFGDDPFGAEGWQTLGTVIVTNGSTSGQIHTQTLALDIENYVYNRLSSRTVNEYGADGQAISGASDAILNEILTEYVPDVSPSQLPTIDDTIDYWVDQKPANKVIDELARLAHVATGDSWILGSDGSALTMHRVGDLTAQWTADDGQTDFEGSFDHSWGGNDMVNEVRVEGGIDSQNLDEEQPTGGTWTTVTESNRLTYQLSPRKPEIGKIHLWIRHIAGSNDDLLVRIQSDDGAGNPVAIDDHDSDIISERWDVPDGFDGENHVRFGEHVLGPKDTPHLIIEATDVEGVEVETDGSGNPRFHSHFPKPIIVRVPDLSSQDRYRIHDETIDDDSLQTFQSARDRARRRLDQAGTPTLEFDTEAASSRAHALDVADVVTLDWPSRRTEGDYITTALSHTYEGNLLQTDLTLKAVDSFV